MKVTGYGVGFRPQHFSDLIARARGDGPAWIEALSENFMGAGGQPRRNLLRLRESYPVCLHGVSMSIAGQDDFSETYLKDLKELVNQVQPIHVSDHLCWTSFKGHNTHDLLPVPYTAAMLDHVCTRIQMMQDHLDRPLLFENPSAYVAFGVDAISEAEFLSEMCRRTGCGLILDVNNLFVNHKNLGVDVVAWLSHINPASIGYMHVSGHTVTDTIRVDTHDHPACEEVWDLYSYINTSFGRVAAMIEWDDHIPEFTDLMKETSLLEINARRNMSVEQIVKVMPPIEGDVFKSDQSDWRHVQQEFFASVTAESGLSPQLLRAGTPAAASVGLDVYAHAYTARLVSVFRDSFPVLAHVLGRTHFDDLVERYLAWHHPRHYSVKYASAMLKNFPGITDTAKRTGIDATLLKDLISFEWLLYDLRDAPGDEKVLTRDALTAITPDQWASVVFAVQSATAQLNVSYRVDLVLKEFHESGEPRVPVKEDANLLVYRSGSDVSWILLDAAQSELLRGLRNGLPFEAVCTLVHEHAREGDGIEDVVVKSVTSVGDWMDQGIIAGFSAD